MLSDKDPNLWIRALSYFATADEPCESEIAEILNRTPAPLLLLTNCSVCRLVMSVVSHSSQTSTGSR